VRIALVSDAHGNAIALDAVVAELDREGIERVVCLGDMLQGGAQPAECLAQIRRRSWTIVLGNADAFVLDPRTGEGSAEEVTESQLAVRAWSRDRLSDAEAAAIEAWPLSARVELGHGRQLLAFHATPSSYEPLLLPSSSEEEFRGLLGPVDEDLAAGGHTHLQFVRRCGPTTFVNPGSVGLGYDHEQEAEGFTPDSWASYAVVTSSRTGLRIELRRVEFDADTVAEVVRSSGMPEGDASALMWERAAAAERRRSSTA
jgi:putative phosphoesterase